MQQTENITTNASAATTAQTEAAQETVATILEAVPCPQCGTVEVLRDARIFGATCDCGRKEGCQTRWEVGDMQYGLTAEQVERLDKALEILGD